MDNPISFCLYARKSSESDERQTMSIDSQIKEMLELAKKNNLEVKEVREESHSAKASGCRPVFNEIIKDIERGFFTGILTWAPDRLSRNAGDLGKIVDLIDQKKLIKIQTYSQSFCDNPNEKFMLMILCSQAKLENDQKSLNVKRGLRAKCELGWRPAIAPIGYVNIRIERHIELIDIDKERAPYVIKMFHRVANQGHSGRTIKEWLDMIGFKTKNDKRLSLSRIYETLKNPFYYGRFEFNGVWYDGKHTPLISKTLFDKAQKQMVTAPKEWHKRVFPFKSLCKCASCGGGITAEDKIKKMKYGNYKKHIYYHCAKHVDYHCKEPYIRESDLIKQLIANIDNIKINENLLSKSIKAEISRYHMFKSQVLQQEFRNGNLNDIEDESFDLDMDTFSPDKARSYLIHVLKSGSEEERQNILSTIKTKFTLHNRELRLA
ncbi:MAG: recombinase family protein [Candidatus Roizmanbacteria bacterium]|nr:recombinase family protein [Candidatus Roizmanbacteria bacterium]